MSRRTFERGRMKGDAGAALRRDVEEIERVGAQLAKRMAQAFKEVAIEGRKFDDIMRKLSLSISDAALDSALRPFVAALGSSSPGFSGKTSDRLGASGRWFDVIISNALRSVQAADFPRNDVRDSGRLGQALQGPQGVHGAWQVPRDSEARWTTMLGRAVSRAQRSL